MHTEWNETGNSPQQFTIYFIHIEIKIFYSTFKIVHVKMVKIHKNKELKVKTQGYQMQTEQSKFHYNS